MKFVCYSNLHELPGSADALFAQAEKDSLFYTRPWFENLTARLPDEESILFACVVDGGKVMALLPLIENTENNYISLKHRYSTHYSPLLADDDRQEVLTCLVEGLKQLPLRSLLLEPVANDDDRLVSLQGCMQAAGYACEFLFRSYNWVYYVRGQSFDQYMAGRPARLRNTISRKQRKLERDHGYEIRLFTGDEVPQAMSDYYAVYTASWKANEQYTDFVDGMVASLSGPGWSRLGVLYVDDKPVAAQLWFVLHGKASIFRLAYDKAWKIYSPGSILTSFLMEYVIDTDRVEEIDFLTGNDTYKQDWMSDRRQRFALSCVNKVKPAGRVEEFAGFLKRMLRRK